MIRYGDSLTYFLNGYLHNPDDAEDLMIEVFARLIVKRPKIGEGNFKAYIYRSARNLATRFHEKKIRTQMFSLDEIGEKGMEPALSGDGFADDERRKILHICLGRIPPEMREALWLFYFEGMSYADIAAVMRVNKKRIDHLLSKGRDRLKRELEKEGVTDAVE